MYDENGLCYGGGANGGVHIFDQKGDLGLVVKTHAGEVTALACTKDTVVSAGKDDQLAIISNNQGEFSFVRHIPMNQQSFASCLDILDGMILVGQDNGKILTVGVDGNDQKIISNSHTDGENWGLEVIQDKGTFLTSGDDNKILEINIKDKKVMREGKVWSAELFDGQHYKTKKIKSTASTLCD